MKKNIRNKLFFSNLSDDFGIPIDAVGEKMLREYGALFVVAGNGAVSPDKVVFENEREVAEWQKTVKSSKKTIAGFPVELQTAAMKALKKAIKEAAQNDLKITPRGADAARRSYAETVDLWASRVNPALLHWVEKGRLTEPEAEKIRSLSPFEQVSEIFKLEAEGIFFSKDLSKSIVYSVAPPGTSQHLSMLALDVQEHGDAEVREILARNGWFQTVISDLPHFTYLGISESELANYGLKKITDAGRDFWIPDL
jgi:hypothetical protein